MDQTVELNCKEVTSHPSLQSGPSPSYAGDLQEAVPSLEQEYRKLDFANPAIMLAFFDPQINEGSVILNKWQAEELELLGHQKSTSQHPFKYCLVGSNGSGKDKYIIAPFSVWFLLTKIQSRVIITTASGTQLTSQTEPYIKDLCQKVNSFFGGQEVFRIRQRYITCRLTGSEIRMFATDESGKAEGYHPIIPNAEMAIIVNEGKSVTEDIHRALRRCTGFNYWLEISSAGEPSGFFYYAATKWPRVRYISSYECLQISRDEIEEDKKIDGESSAYFRSKHLSRFTSIGGQVIIPLELMESLLTTPPTQTLEMPTRIGIDLAAGGDENAICFTKGSKCIKEYAFKERDTTIAADRIEHILLDHNITREYSFIYADDGGIGRGIIDNLNRRGWQINRIMNQWASLGNKKQFGNRGAENWWRCKRILEERMFDVSSLGELTRKQLVERHYKQTLTGGRLFLEQKKEAIAEGRLSPDRADAFILSLSGLTLDDFLKAPSTKTESKRPRTILSSQQALYEHYEDSVTFERFNSKEIKRGKSKCYGSLRKAMNN